MTDKIPLLAETVNDGSWSLTAHYGKGDDARDAMRATADALRSPPSLARKAASADVLAEALEQARRDIISLAVSGTDRIDELCKKLQKLDPSPIWPIPFPDPPERTWQPLVKRIDKALTEWSQS